MDTVKLNNTNVKMIAHRGLSGLECENTAAAFIAAANRSYYGIESDVHVTADGKFVMHHDDKTGRIFEKDLKIEATPFEKLIALQKKKDSGKTPESMRRDLVIPTLDDYIDICKRYNKKAILEIKNEFSAENIRKLIRYIDSYGYLDDTVFISFYWENLIKLRTFLPNQKVQFLTGSCEGGLTQKLIDHRFDLDILFSGLTSSDVAALHNAGLEVNCWTVNSAQDAQKMLELGVDYITTNILE